MTARPHLVLTSINSANEVMRALAEGSRQAGWRFIVAGDTKSPPDFQLEGCDFLDVAAQVATGFCYAAACPTRHYARKNIGYLVAIRHEAPVIVETDDDNFPRPAFFGRRSRRVTAAHASAKGWLNAYRYFTDGSIWPRGLPLDAVNDTVIPFDALSQADLDCPIQQGLADENPDVDAIYRLLLPLPQQFRTDRRLTLGRGTWCPFNSQNTTWWPEAFPLLYLPAHCSFRMTDIWRSFVAQRIAWENNWHILFHEPTVWQERNAHDLMRDFADEVPGYLHNRRIQSALENLSLTPGAEHIPDNLRRCYACLVELGVVGRPELPLLDAWLADLAELGLPAPAIAAPSLVYDDDLVP